MKVSDVVALVVKDPPANAGELRESSSALGAGRSLEEEMAAHSSILAWKIAWTEEPGGQSSPWSCRVRRDWRNLARTQKAPDTRGSLSQ